KRFAAGPSPLPARDSQTSSRLIAQPIICYVTDSKALPADKTASTPPNKALLDTIRAAAAAGVDWVQIREKGLATRDLFELVREAVALAPEAPGPTQSHSIKVIVNDRLDVALGAGAAGVHLGHASAPAGEVVRWCRAGNAPPDFLIGVSCHSLEGAREAESAGASYTYFGPIYETPSKIPFGKPHGVGELAQVAKAVRIPVIAIGGINESNAVECIRAGAAGIAAIRMIQDAADSTALKTAIEAIHRSS
ncbi:MAG TPA: thiamine phosphate synthase, partial [Candidatus Acidoferrales bacterium]